MERPTFTFELQHSTMLQGRRILQRTNISCSWRKGPITPSDKKWKNTFPRIFRKINSASNLNVPPTPIGISRFQKYNHLFLFSGALDLHHELILILDFGSQYTQLI